MRSVSDVTSTIKPRTRLRKALERVDDVYARTVTRERRAPEADVLVLGIYRDDRQISAAIDELRQSRHRTTIALGAMGTTSPALTAETRLHSLDAGKFQNLNSLLDTTDDHYDWLVLLDDDIDLPPGFLDRVLEVCARYDFALAQPAQTRQSHANWSVARRRLLSVARLTRFVEIGPLTLVRRDAAKLLLPFPYDLRYGWGLDFSWAHIMRSAGLRCGVIDSAAVVHAARAVASTYSWDAAQAEGQQFLRSVPHEPTSVAHETVETYRLMR